MNRSVKSYACRICQNLCEPALDQLCMECRREAPAEIPSSDSQTWQKLGGGIERRMVPGGWIYSHNGAICFVPDADRSGGRHA